MIEYLLDTTTVSDYLRREPSVLRRMHETTPQAIAISSITKYEIAYGLYKKPSLKKQYSSQLEELYQKTCSLNFNEDAAYTTGRIRHFLISKGQPVAIEDMMIASIALQHGLTVVTSNTKHFNRMIDLNKLEDWKLL